MTANRRKIRLWLMAGIVIALTAIGITRLTDAFQLRHVTYNGAAVENYRGRFGLDDSTSVFEQPLDSLADAILAERNVFRVDINLSLPHELHIRTNNFEPRCFIVDRVSGRMYGLTGHARLVELETVDRDWEHPIITGAETGSLYDECRDGRIAIIVDELSRLEKRNVDLYRLIDQIDVNQADFTVVTLAGAGYRALVRSPRLSDHIIRFADFVSRHRARLDSVREIDMRFDNMIVTRDKTS